MCIYIQCRTSLLLFTEKHRNSLWLLCHVIIPYPNTSENADDLCTLEKALTLLGATLDFHGRRYFHVAQSKYAALLLLRYFFFSFFVNNFMSMVWACQWIFFLRKVVLGRYYGAAICDFVKTVITVLSLNSSKLNWSILVQILILDLPLDI